MTPGQLTAFLGGRPPFDSLSAEDLAEVGSSATVATYRPGQVVLDAFLAPPEGVYVVVSGRVDMWLERDTEAALPDRHLGPGGVLGFSSLLTQQPAGPRAVAGAEATTACIPAALATRIFSSETGAEFLAGQVAANARGGGSSYTLVDELIVKDPLVVEPDTDLAETATRMIAGDVPYAAVRLPEGQFGLVTNAVLTQAVLVDKRPAQTPVSEVMVRGPAMVRLGDSAAEALIALLERDAELVLVVDRADQLRGVALPSDFMVSTSTAGISLHEQVRRANTLEELHERAGRMPDLLAGLLTGGLSSGKVITVHSAVVDSVVRRAIQLVFAQHPELDIDAFTWMSLGSNGRREAVLSSDIDAAVAFDDRVPAAEIHRYLAAFAEVHEALTAAGLTTDTHGVSAAQRTFARTNSEWHAAAREWLATPTANNGAMMTSLLVDGRPIHGDPGLPAVTRVFGALRRHPATMRLLLLESLSKRAKVRKARNVLGGHADRFDFKEQALLPIVNLARWAALSVGAAALPTTERLRMAAGSEVLPEERAATLIEVFGVLQRIRLRYQLQQVQEGNRATDIVERDHLSAIDRSAVTQAVREIAAVQRRARNLSAYLEAESLADRPAPG